MSENGLYKLRPITDNPNYEGFGSVSLNSIRGHALLGLDFLPNDVKTKGRSWTVTRMASIWTPLPVKGRVRAFNDYPCVNLTIPAFSGRAVEALRPFLEPNGELLPLASDMGEYFAYNITTKADILDHERSEIKWDNLPGFEGQHVTALDIERYECIPERMEGLSIFRLVEDIGPAFVTQPFVDRVKEHRLQGFHFTKLWPLGKGVIHWEEDKKQRRKEELVETKRGPVYVKGNTVVIRFELAKAEPNKADQEFANKLIKEIDGLLYIPTGDAPIIGSLEGYEFSNGECRLFLTCPDADALVEKLHPWLKALSWPKPVWVLKRYGEYVDPNCREETVEL